MRKQKIQFIVSKTESFKRGNKKARSIFFTKMAGAGNDFIIVEDPNNICNRKLARMVCDRNTGLGADGLLVLKKTKKADFKMRIINPDGSIAEMCGNGARCMAAYIAINKRPKKNLFSIETKAGIIMAEAKDEIATVRLSDPKNYKEKVRLTTNGKKIDVSYIDTGVPHAVVFVDNLENIDVNRIGALIRYNSKFKPRGANVNFVEQINSKLVNARTYERGVEAETKACGTGSVASALVTYLRSNPKIKDIKNAQMKVRTKNGEILKISFDIVKNKVTNVWLNGSAKFIAKGEYYV